MPAGIALLIILLFIAHYGLWMWKCGTMDGGWLAICTQPFMFITVPVLAFMLIKESLKVPQPVQSVVVDPDYESEFDRMNREAQELLAQLKASEQMTLPLPDNVVSINRYGHR
jgi:hypothetical protein